jgi:predicted ATPase
VAAAKLSDALWSYPEILRVDAELILHAGLPDAAKKAEAKLLQSLELSQSQALLSFELRTATSLARLWGRTRRAAKARALLQATSDKFTEGFATGDMKQARELLEKLS